MMGGDRLLQVKLPAGKIYPGISLRYFPVDWSDSDWVKIRLNNPASKPLHLTVKIHDRLHEQSYEFRDRYNSNVRLGPGWATPKIDLKQVFDAPRGRKMNLREISNLNLFSSLLEEDMTFYVERIYLSQ